MLVITGLGRSGTSCLANFCCLCGHNTGGGWIPAIDAGREGESVRINTKIRDDYLNNTWEVDNYKQSIISINRRVIKDPRFTWKCPAILPTWKAHAPGIKFILCHRDLNEITESKKATNSKTLITFEQNKDSTGTFLIRLCDLDLSFRVLKFPLYLEQYDKVHSVLTGYGGLDINYETGKEIWKGWVRPRKKVFI